MGKINYNDIFYIKILSLQHVVSTKLSMRYFTFFFFCRKSLKPDYTYNPSQFGLATFKSSVSTCRSHIRQHSSGPYDLIYRKYQSTFTLCLLYLSVLTFTDLYL